MSEQNTMSTDITIEQILNEFLDVSQSVYSKLEQLDKVIENIEIILVPTERRLLARIREHQNNSVQTHQLDRNLVMKEVDFDKHMANQAPPGVRLRQYDQRNLNPQTIEKILTTSPISTHNEQDKTTGH
jgi:hypothetical protein